MLAARSFSQNDFRLADSNYAVPSQMTASNKKEQKFMVLWTKRESFMRSIVAGVSKFDMSIMRKHTL